MGRTSKLLTSGLLICALAAVSVPVGLQLAPAFLPQEAGAVAVVPEAQKPPTALGTVTGVSPLDPQAPLPDSDKLAADLRAALSFDGPGEFGMYVADAATGQELFSQNGTKSMTPASNMKLLTATAVLQTLGTDARFSTKTVLGTGGGQLVLVAGGDTMLAAGESKSDAVMGHAGLATLAADTAKALAVAGIKGPVNLAIDDSLFTGAAVNPKWDAGDLAVGEIAPIFPMALYAGHFLPGEVGGQRPQDSSLAVAEAFARALEGAGVATTGTIARVQAPGAPEGTQSGPGTILAAVQSATVAEQTQYMLDESDNYVAEALARLAAVKLDLGGSNSGAVAAVRKVVGELGVPLDGVVTNDASGLAVGNVISPERLVKVLNYLVENPTTPAGAALRGLPIAGLSGSLTNRFVSGGPQDGAGIVRAKTGSLNNVTALSGYVVNAHGRLLVFSIIGNDLDGRGMAARPVADAAANVLARS